MKGPLLLSIVVCAGVIFYSRYSGPKESTNADVKNKTENTVSKHRTDSINNAIEHYERHNKVPQ